MPNSAKPSVDVVIPCYNYAHYLEQCVVSVLSQRDVDLRILIIDDCSPDNTAEVAARLAAADTRVSYVRNPSNLGLIGTANRGVIDWATATYTLLLSADDYLLPGSLARATWVMDRRPDVHMTYGMALIVRDAAAPIATQDHPVPTWKVIEGRDYIRKSCETGVPAPSPSVLVRTSEQKNIGGYNPAFPHTSDMDMWMRFAARGPIAVIQDPQAAYRWHGGNMTLAYPDVRDRRMRIQTCEHVYAHSAGDSIPGFAQWIGAMKRAYGRDAYFVASRALEDGNQEKYHAAIDFMKQYAPEVLHAGKWKLRLRHLIGPTLASKMRGAVNRLRRQPEQEDWFSLNHILGWWPEVGASGGGELT